MTLSTAECSGKGSGGGGGGGGGSRVMVGGEGRPDLPVEEDTSGETAGDKRVLPR